MRLMEIVPLEKGKLRLEFEDAKPLEVYQSEVLEFGFKAQMQVSEELYSQIFFDILGKRVKRRAMYLLEKRDRTEEELRTKLSEGGYPTELVDAAIDYVKSHHYLDDERYARNFVRLNQERRSRQRMRQDLQRRGISEELISQALEEENDVEQEALIRQLMEKRNYDPDTATPKEKQKMYRFLMGRGFRLEEIRRSERMEA